MVLRIKHMVCGRCIRIVQKMLTELEVQVHSVVLGEATISSVNAGSLHQIRTALRQNGFELLEDEKLHLVEKIKHIVTQYVYSIAYDDSVNIIDYVAKQVKVDTPSVSSLFSLQEGLTLEKFIIRQKLERVKTLLDEGTITLSEIAHLMGYSSVAHLSAQFKKVVGISATEYKNNINK